MLMRNRDGIARYNILWKKKAFLYGVTLKHLKLHNNRLRKSESAGYESSEVLSFVKKTTDTQK